MLEAVGHEFMEMFFSRCEAALAENGLIVLQVIYSSSLFLFRDIIKTFHNHLSLFMMF